MKIHLFSLIHSISIFVLGLSPAIVVSGSIGDDQRPSFSSSTSWLIDAHQSQLRRRLQTIRTDLVRLIPFDVQIAIEDDTAVTDGSSTLVAENLYQGGTLLTDTIGDWMIESFETKTSRQAGLVNNNTSFDSIALELVNEQTFNDKVFGNQKLNLIQVSFEGVSLWERQGTGTPPMAPEIVELIQRATFLEDKKLKEDLQTTIDNLLIDLGVIDAAAVAGGEQSPVTIVDVRAFITPAGANNENGGSQESSSNTDGSSNSSNQNLEIIIIVAIIVACLAFALLIFAVVWAWRSDKRNNDDKPIQAGTAAGGAVTGEEQRKKKSKRLSRSATSETSRNSRSSKNKQKKEIKSRGSSATQNHSGRVNGSRNSGEADIAGANNGFGGAEAYERLPNKSSYNSDPSEIGNDVQGVANSNYPDSGLSEDVSSSFSAYYKSGLAYNSSNSGRLGGGTKDFNDAASLSSMDSYGYSLDGYAPSLGPAQGGYPVGPLAAAKDAPITIGDSTDNMDIVQLQQEEESIVDYDAEAPGEEVAA